MTTDQLKDHFDGLVEIAKGDPNDVDNAGYVRGLTVGLNIGFCWVIGVVCGGLEVTLGETIGDTTGAGRVGSPIR